MIVTCEECSTRFNLDDSLVKNGGSKVRCSVCKHIFTVFPAPLELEDTFEPDMDFDQPSEMTDTPVDEDTAFEGADQSETEDHDFSLEDTQIDFDDTDLEVAPDVEAASDPEEKIESDMDDGLSFDDEDGDLEMTDTDELSFEVETQEPEFEIEVASDDTNEDDETLDFDDAAAEEFDGLEFEGLDDDTEELSLELDSDDTPQDMSLELEADDDESGITPLPDDSNTELESDDDFELEFDVSEDDGTQEDEPAPALSGLTIDASDKEEEEETDLDVADTFDEADLSVEPIEDEDDAETDFDEYDKVLEQETEPDEELEAEAEVEPGVIYEDQADSADSLKSEQSASGDPLDPSRRRRKKKPLIGAPVLILLLLFLVLVGAYIAGLMTGYKIPVISDVKIPFLEEIFKKKAPNTAELNPVPNQKTVNGRFVTNSTAGTLFVITGTVDNPSTVAYSHIKVKGALIVKGKVAAKTKTAYCGNIITEDILKTGNITDINKMLEIKTGNNNSNVNVKAGSNVPFMVVFSDLPEKLQNFTVKVIAFDKSQ